MAGLTARLDFADPRNPQAPRLRQCFGTPREVLVAHEPAQVRTVLDAVEQAARAGCWCLGYLRYEAASAFDPALTTHPADGPLAWFAVHDAPLADEVGQAEPAGLLPDAPRLRWLTGPDRTAFDAAMRHILQAIASGECYQVNLTAPLTGVLDSPLQAGGDPGLATQALFEALRAAQPGGYAGWLDTGEGQHILSMSPELFFDWRGGELLARPMKGTAPRGADPAADAALAQGLRESAKERAENVMIVDLLRNDVSRVAEPFSVRVPRLFHTEALPTVWQMTSDVAARTRAGCRLSDVFAALFPCGSVTGAPKAQAMRTIRALEDSPRGVYCGAFGVVRPDGDGGLAATFNVPIRTLTLRGDQVRCGIGSGVTAGASADGEWREWRHKQAFAQRISEPFELLETLRLADGELCHRVAHRTRLAGAARHFGYPWDAAAVDAALQALVAAHPLGVWRVRLLLDARGRLRAEAFAMNGATPQPVRLQLADRPFEAAHSEFVRFKTTRRAHYDAFAPTLPGAFDTLLWNEDGELTECTRGNVALRIDGTWLTPAASAGLLAGVGRAQALADGRLREAVLRREDLARAQALAFVNSLRGWLPAVLEPAAAGG